MKLSVQLPRSNEKDVDFALDAAHAAFLEWGKTSITRDQIFS